MNSRDAEGSAERGARSAAQGLGGAAAPTGAPSPTGASRSSRVVFLGTPDFAVPVLRALLDAPETTVALVVTQPDRPAGRGRRLSAPPVKVLAEAHGLAVFQPERLRGGGVLDRLRAADADL